MVVDLRALVELLGRLLSLSGGYVEQLIVVDLLGALVELSACWSLARLARVLVHLEHLAVRLGSGLGLR